MFDTIGLIGKHGDDRVVDAIERLVSHLRARGVELLFDAESARDRPDFGMPVASREEIGGRCDLVIVVAGDGTFLGAARSLVEHGVPLLGINLGRLGFLADIMPDEMAARVDAILDGDFEEEERFLLEVSVDRGGERRFSGRALNEAVAHKWNIARLIEFETRIDGRLVNRQRSDGLIVATPTGSTAYALSGGGPILHVSLDAIVLVPICPHTLTSRPLVVRGESHIEILVGDAESSEAQLTCDGQTTVELEPRDRIRVGKHAQRLRLIHPRGHDHYATLRAKLQWGTGA